MNDMTTTDTANALALPGKDDLRAAFKSDEGIAKIIAHVETLAREHEPDLTTGKGRKAIASLAHKVSRSKTAIDAEGKALSEDLAAKRKAVNARRATVEDKLSELRGEVRKPLDEWEAQDAKRIEAIKDRLAALDAGRADAMCSPAQIKAVMADIEAVEIDDSWDEFRRDAEDAKRVALGQIQSNLMVAEKREEDAAELARLREAEAKRRAEEEAQRRKEAEQEAAEKIGRGDVDYAKPAPEAESQPAPRRMADMVRSGDLTVETGTMPAPQHDAPTADQRRAQVLREITEAVFMTKREDLPEAIMQGRIPYVRVVV